MRLAISVILVGTTRVDGDGRASIRIGSVSCVGLSPTRAAYRTLRGTAIA